MFRPLIFDRRSMRSVAPRAFSLFCLIAVITCWALSVVVADEFTSELRNAAEPVEVTIGQAIVISGPETQQNDGTEQKVATELSNESPDEIVVLEAASTDQPAEVTAENVEIVEEVKEAIATDSISQDERMAEENSAVTELTESADSQDVGIESVGEAVVDVADTLVGPSEELQKVIEVLHASAESVEPLVEASSETDAEKSRGSFLKIMEASAYEVGSPMVESQEVPSPSDLDAAESIIAAGPSLQELRRQRAAEIARLRAIRLQQQIRSGYSPLRPRWNAIPMMSTRYSRPVVYVPVYGR